MTRIAIDLADLEIVAALMPPGDPRSAIAWDGEAVTVPDEALAAFGRLYAEGALTDVARAEHAARAAAKAEAAARAECGRRIEARASEATQRNMSLFAGVLALVPPASRTPEQNAAVQGLIDAEIWVTAMRARWPEIVAEGLDPLDDANWPEPSPAAIALAARF